MGATLGPPYLIWDKIQLTAFFAQETFLSLLYIFESRKRLRNSSMLHQDKNSREVFKHLIYVNALVIFLDCSLLALSYANFFYVQSAYKPCVYGVKLRVEFAILNRLISSVQDSSRPSYHHGDTYKHSKGSKPNQEDTVRLESFSCRSERSNTMIFDKNESERRSSDADASGLPERGIMQTTEISVVPDYQQAYIISGKC